MTVSVKFNAGKVGSLQKASEPRQQDESNVFYTVDWLGKDGGLSIATPVQAQDNQGNGGGREETRALIHCTHFHACAQLCSLLRAE